MPEMNYTEMLENIFGKREDYFLEKGNEDTFYLSRWILPRLLLGKNIEPAREYVKSQINLFEPSQRIDIALKDFAMLAALSEIYDISAKKIIEKAVKHFSAAKNTDEDNHDIVKTILAFSFYLNDEGEITKWRKRAMCLPFETGAEYLVFELLYLSSFENDEIKNAEHFVNITAKIIYKVLTGAPFLSSAPHILVLAALFKNTKSVGVLLSGRIKKLDEIILNDKSKTAVKFSKFNLAIGEKNGFPLLEFLTTVRGEGEIKAGLTDDKILSSDFVPYLSRYTEKEDLFEKVIAFKKTKALVEILLSKNIRISEQEFQLMKNRFILALEISKNHFESITPDFELILKN